jgi:hypothetical protein
VSTLLVSVLLTHPHSTVVVVVEQWWQLMKRTKKRTLKMRKRKRRLRLQSLEQPLCVVSRVVATNPTLPLTNVGHRPLHNTHTSTFTCFTRSPLCGKLFERERSETMYVFV